MTSLSRAMATGCASTASGGRERGATRIACLNSGMFVLCPHCQFLVGLESASGEPPERCPRCHERLQPLDAASTADPPPDPAAAAESVPAVAPAAQVAGEAGDASTDTTPQPPTIAEVDSPIASADMAENADMAVMDGPADDASDVASTVERVPSHNDTIPPAPVVRSRSRWWRAAATRRWLRLAGVPVLVLVLGLQCVLATRAQLASDARWRPLVTRICAALGCTLPAWHQPGAFTLLDRSVRPDPRHPGVLHVTAGFRNDADWPQAWPSLVLTLSDADGRIAGARAFAPHEYLASVSTQKMMASGQRARVVLDVVEPANGVVAFTFDFR
jgi:Protein of unknown function (DUF3426)